MAYRRSEFDVTDRVDTTDVQQVCAEVCRIYQDLYQRGGNAALGQAFRDFQRLYRGDEAAYHACDTAYHDIQHVLDVTLAMARMMDGTVRATNATVITERLFVFGIVNALFHDAGYLRRRRDTRHRRGAEYTRTHVSRGARMLEKYFVGIGMAELGPVAARVVHFTGYEMPITDIRVDPEFRLIGNLLGSADLLAQMADRCYLEKCHDRLYPEFVDGGLAEQRGTDGKLQVIYGSAADLIYKTSEFSRSVTKRLEQDLGGDHRRVERHFGGQHVYWEELQKNVRHAEAIAAKRDIGMLRRQPPVTLKA
ncbi:MAG: hypothetical protein ACM3SS_18750 [Rhodospirillaceae bacterium]